MKYVNVYYWNYYIIVTYMYIYTVQENAGKFGYDLKKNKNIYKKINKWIRFSYYTSILQEYITSIYF